MAFHTCSFTPKLQIDSNQWKVKEVETTINDKAVGEYREGKYRLYTEAELDIKVERKPIVQREKTTGIFGGTARKKDGFMLKITNKSDKPKTLTVTERIPTSTTEEIKVKLLEVKSDKKVNYRLLKDGEIEMKLILTAHENKNIEVLFEISYDKDLKVNY
jgi:putative cell wall-binding protein